MWSFRVPGNKVVGGAVVVVALLALGSARAAQAGAYVYWANDHSYAIERATLQGTGNQRLTTSAGYPSGVAVGDGHIYWTSGTDAIGRANLDGSEADQSFITATFDPRGVAVDGQHVYWTNYLGTIGRANLDGSEADESFIDVGTALQGLAVDSGHIYWTDGGAAIGRANLDGTDVERDFITGSNLSQSVAVDSGHVYWSNYDGSVGRAKLDGSEVDQSFIAGAYGLDGVAVDSEHVYWSNYASGEIGRANLDGSNPEPGFVTGALAPIGLAVDGGVPSAPLCSKLKGGGSYEKLGEPGRLNLHDNLSTSLAGKQELTFSLESGTTRLRLVKAEEASCLPVPGGLSFSGSGRAYRDGGPGYELSYSITIATDTGAASVSAILTKEGAVVDEAAASPLSRSSEVIG